MFVLLIDNVPLLQGWFEWIIFITSYRLEKMPDKDNHAVERIEHF